MSLDQAIKSVDMANNLFFVVLLPVGFAVGMIMWSRVAHTAIALAGLTPNPTAPPSDFATLETAYRKVVVVIAAGWLLLIGAVLGYMLHTQRTGWALLFGGIFAVPLFTVGYGA